MEQLWFEHNRALLAEACHRVGTRLNDNPDFPSEVDAEMFLFAINWAESRGEMRLDTFSWLMIRGKSGEIGPPQLLPRYIIDAQEHGIPNYSQYIPWDDYANTLLQIMDFTPDRCLILNGNLVHSETLLIDFYVSLVGAYMLRWGPRRVAELGDDCGPLGVEKKLVQVHHYGGPRANFFDEGEWVEYLGYFLEGRTMFADALRWLKPIHLVDPHDREDLELRVAGVLREE